MNQNITVNMNQKYTRTQKLCRLVLRIGCIEKDLHKLPLHEPENKII